MILVPRPAPHLPRTLAALTAAGLTNLQPLALSHPQPLPFTLPPTTTALLLTSPLAVEALAQSPLPTLPCYCVGAATAHAARTLGLTVAFTGPTNAEAMAQTLTQHRIPNTEHFTHLHGDHADTAWHSILTAAGHTVTPLLAYSTRRIISLPPDLPARIAAAPQLVTILFSAGSASHLANLMKHANMPPIGTAIAFSAAVAHAAKPHWPQVVTAPQPTLASVAATIRHLNISG